MKKLIRIPALLLAGVFVCLSALPAFAAPLESEAPIVISAPAYLLVEAGTGTVIFEKNADERRQAASVTKLMTLLLLLEEIDQGRMALTDQVTVSKNAAATIGSTALLDAGAVYPVEDLLRSTVIASGNDSAVALAEHLAGSEQAFVDRMNRRAAEMGLQNTHYVNCTGLPVQGQYTCARDVGILACAVARYPLYFTYSSLWLSSLTHPSGRVTDLTNTNRLVRFMPGCDGMKTGSANDARYCIAASMEKNGMRLIAVALGAETSQKRFDDARAMLEYGFSAYQRTQVIAAGDLTGYQLPVKRSSRDTVDIAVGKGLSMLLRPGQAEKLRVELTLPESIQAPMAAGSEVGTARVLLDGAVVAVLPAVLAQDARLPGYLEGLQRIREQWR